MLLIFYFSHQIGTTEVSKQNENGHLRSQRSNGETLTQNPNNDNNSLIYTKTGLYDVIKILWNTILPSPMKLSD